MVAQSKYRVTIHKPEPRSVPAGAQDALAHALGAAARILLETTPSITIVAEEDGKFYFCENFEHPDGKCLGEVSPIPRTPRTPAPPTLRPRGARPLSGWYWWSDRNPDRLPEPPTPPMDKVWHRGYVFGFFTRSHELLGYAPAKKLYLSPLLHRRSTIRDQIEPPREAPAGTYYVVVYDGVSGVSEPILYGLMEDFV